MFREATCPACREKIQVPDDREKVICMYCGKEISVAEALGNTPKNASLDVKADMEQIFRMLEEIISQCSNPMQNFKKDSYPDAFDGHYRGYRELFQGMDSIYQNSADKQGTLASMAECLVSAAQRQLEQIRSKAKRNQRQLDYNFLLSIYFIPCVLKFGAGFSEPFAETLVEQWNQAFDTSIGKANFDDINGGFRRKLCYITTAVCEGIGKGSDCYELNVLRGYRDGVLEPDPAGKALVDEYYDLAPTIVKRISREPNRQELYRQLYEAYLRPCVQAIEEERFEDCKSRYQEMVVELKNRFMN